jgi:2-furoyl-CoA dehydrogenase large subunit
MTKPTGAIVGPYRIPNIRYGGYGVLTNKTNQQPFRGAGQSPHNFCLERMMDLVARDLGIDRMEIRLRNYIQPDQFPYTIPGGAIYDSGNYPAACELAADRIDLDTLRKQQIEARAEGRLFGIGFAGGIEPSGGASEHGESLRLEIDRRGKVVATIGFQSAGQSHEGMVTQILCEELGIEPSDVTVERGHGLSGLVAGATVGSRMTLMLGSATKIAADKAKQKMALIAAFVLDAKVEAVKQDGASFQVGGETDRTLTIAEIAGIAYGPRKGCPPGMEPGLIETGVFAGPDKVINRPPGTEAKAFPSYAFDFHIPVVEIDPDTLEIKLIRYLVVHDCGTVLNPLVVDGFVYGGIGHGVGGALYERFRYDEQGQMLSASFMDYLIPTAAEIPHIELHGMVTPSPIHPYGAKGAAEGAYMTAPAAIASAVEDALEPFGIRIDEVPITPQLLFERIGSQV